MSSFLRRRLQLQLLLILVAALSVAALSALLIWESIQNAENAVIADMGRQLSTALGELVGSSRVDLQACKLEYSIVSPK